MASFVEASAVASDGTHHQASIDPDWFIWGPFGGYLAAMAMRAMAARSTLARPATFSCQYLNIGKAGVAHVEVETLKRGRSAECLRAAIRQDGRTLLEAQSWIVADQLPGIAHDDGLSPSVPAPYNLPDWNGFGEESKSPIWRHIQRRPLSEFKYTAEPGRPPQWASWLRLYESFPPDDFTLQAARAVLWMDLAPWNAALNAHGWPTTHLAPTLDLTVQFQPDIYASGVFDWMLVETASPRAHSGLFGAHSKLWSASGQLLAIGAAQGLCIPNPRYAEQMRQRQEDESPQRV